MKSSEMLEMPIGSTAKLVCEDFAAQLDIEVGSELTRTGSGWDCPISIEMSYVDVDGSVNTHFFTYLEMEKID